MRLEASVVVFNEVMYHSTPAAGSVGEWVELQNQYAVSVDISGWQITGGIEFTFPPGTVIPSRSFVIVAENPAQWTKPPDALLLGPFTGRLSNGGDRLDLRDVSGRVLDTLNYDTRPPWPVGADGGGLTLARKGLHLRTDTPDSWEASRQPGGTPGFDNFPAYRNRVTTPVITVASPWRFVSTVPEGGLWKNADWNDSTWGTGAGPFTEAGSILANLGIAGTVLDPVPVARYFRSKFEVRGNSQLSSLVITSWVDDGAVFYLNGNEVSRFNMPTGVVNSATPASSGILHASPVVMTLPRGILQPGTNTLAVEVHQGPVLASYPRAVAVSRPVLYWRFTDGTEIIQDSSAVLGAQSGLATGFSETNLKQLGLRPVDTVQGKNLRGFESLNPALRFAGNTDDGNDVVVVPYSEALDFGGQQPFSVELWVHGPAVQEEGAGLVSRGVGGGGEQFALDVFGGKFRFFTRSAQDPNQVAVATAAVGPVNGWQHVVAVHDPARSAMSLYVNGVLSGTAPANAELPALRSNIAAGSRLGVDGQYNLNFSGRLDELALYRQALTAEEVSSHFNAAFEAYSTTNLDVSDITFLLQAQVEELIPEPSVPQVRFNESRLVTGEPAALEVLNFEGTSLDLSGWVLEALHAGDKSDAVSLGPVTIPSGGRVVFQTELNPLQVRTGDRVLLWTAGRTRLVDAVILSSGRRSRWPEGQGDWRATQASTLGQPNAAPAAPTMILSELMFHPRGVPAKPDVFGSGAELISLTNRWWFRADGVDLGTNWRAGSGLESAWALGSAPFIWPSNIVFSGPRNSLLPLTNAAGNRLVTHYFKTSFALSSMPTNPFLRLTPLVDDGAVVYLNGLEVARLNMPLGETITAKTLSAANVGNPVVGNAVSVPALGLVSGENWIAVELHQSSTNNQDLAFAVQVELLPRLESGSPYRESNNAWIELQNISTAPVVLDGWSLGGGVDYAFPSNTVVPAGGFVLVAQAPAELAASDPPCAVLGPFQGRLSHGSERVELRDPLGNAVHSVKYFGGGRWPDLADGAGSSLELRHPNAHPAVPESWAASDESHKLSQWQTFRWRGLGVVGQTGEPDVWKELALALLDGPGEVWVDDVSVVENPATTPRELIVNGSFETGNLSRWRFLGTHRRSAVIPDPARPGNHVLQLVATGAGEYQGNQIETTLTNNLTISPQREYEISFKALWKAGGRKLNARLYFNRLARTFDLKVPDQGGTPGTTNSVAVPNVGPGILSMRHSPAVPAPFQLIPIRAEILDSDGVQEAQVHFRPGNSSWQQVAMQRSSGGTSQETWTAEIPGQPAGTLIQFYVEAFDTRGAPAFFPPSGPDSRALIRVEDGQADPLYLHHLRILMTDADATFLHTGTNTLSNELLPCTVIDNETDVYYDVGVRLKGSFVGRNVARVGFHVGFHEDQLYRGRHRTLSVDRSQHAATGGIGEVVAKHIANAAGGIPSSYDDIAFLVAPIKSYNVVAQLRMSAMDSEYLDGWWNKGSDGPVFEVEVHRWNVATIDGKPESLKVVGNESGGTGYTNLELQDWGPNPEVYRWNHLLTNRRDVDDYSGAIRMCQLFDLPQASFNLRADSVLDVEQWLRVMAYQVLVGPGDAVYTGGAVHNFRYYVRPGDDRVLYVPWDWDSSWQSVPSNTLFGSGNVAKLVTAPDFRRRYLNHLHDLVTTVFNKAYMSPWITHYGEVGNQDLRSILTYIDDRAKYVLTQLPLTTPFTVSNRIDSISTNAEGLYVLGGSAPITVQDIQVNGVSYAVRWLNNTNWQVVLNLAPGTNFLQVQGFTLRGQILTNALVQTRAVATGGQVTEPLVINEWMASNQGPTGVPDPADGLFQDWFELFNPNVVPVNLSGSYLSDVPALPKKWRVPDGVVMAPRSYLVIWADNSPEQTTLQVPVGEAPRLHASFALSDGGESIVLTAPDGVTTVSSVTFGPQTVNVSQGSYPDGSVSRGGVWFQSRPTPGAPNQAETTPRIIETSLGRDALGRPILRLIFASQPGSSYVLDTRPGWEAGDWSPAGGAILATQTQTLITIPLTQNVAFFRIRL